MPRRSGALDVRPEIIARVSRAWQAGAYGPGDRPADLRVRDLERSDLVFVCRHDVPRGELLVVTLWEEGEEAAVPRRFTDALRDHDRRRRPRVARGEPDGDDRPDP